MATNDQRSHAVAIMQFFLDNKGLLPYRAVRPMSTKSLYEADVVSMFKRNMPITTDCSEIVTLICRWSGYKDPSGMGYNGFGNSATMFDNLGHYTNPAQAHAGALVVFGPGGSTHVAMMMEPAKDPIIFSHGSPGAIQIPLSQYVAAEPSQKPVTFLDVGSL